MKYTRADIAKGFMSQADKHGVKKATQDTAALILEQRLHGDLDQIIDDIAREYAKQKGIIEAEVKTAFKLTADARALIIEKVKQKTGAKTIKLHETIDRSLLGGVIVTAPDMELDLSLKTKLAKLKA